MVRDDIVRVLAGPPASTGPRDEDRAAPGSVA
jgi:hypothetical protein